MPGGGESFFFFDANLALGAKISILPQRRRKIPQPETAAAVFEQFFFFFLSSRQSFGVAEGKFCISVSKITLPILGFVFFPLGFFALI